MAAELFPNSSWRDHPPVSMPGQDEFVPVPGDQAGTQEEEEAQPKNEPVKPAVPRSRRRRARPQEREIRKPARRHHRGRLAALETHDSQLAASSSQLTTRNSQLAGNWQLATDNSFRPGSNNWVISGAHTASGKPLLSNDMHLAHHIPNVWYEAHLTSGTYDVAGVTLPGLPYVVAGHNQRIAWGFTNIGPAVTDLFVETINERGEYQTPEGWRPVEQRREVIHVRGGLDETVDVAITRHGPIVSALFPGETRQLALKWTIYDPATMQVSLFDLNSAQNWNDFRNALSRFGNPAQNVVYADVDGHIGYQAAGMVPIRATGDGSLPVPGNDNAHEWTSYVPFDKLPSSYDPPAGVIATANSRITPDGYPYVISNEWAAPHRTDRIYHVLTDDKRFTPSDMLALQTDIYSDLDRFCAERFVYALDHASGTSARAHQATEMMRSWDGRVTADSSTATIVAASRYELKRLLLQDKLGDAWKDYQWFMSSVWLEDMILRQPPEWLPAKYADWNALLAASVEAAINGKDSPHNLNDWHWGRQEPLNLQHPLFGMVPLLRRWTGTGWFEQSGNGYTVKQVGSHFGPSERMTVDFSNLDGSTLNIVTGQSGQIFSSHYMDQWKAWYEGHTFPLPFTSAAVQQNAKHTLVLEPK
jgi:penicillin amidase